MKRYCLSGIALAILISLPANAAPAFTPVHFTIHRCGHLLGTGGMLAAADSSAILNLLLKIPRLSELGRSPAFILALARKLVIPAPEAAHTFIQTTAAQYLRRSPSRGKMTDAQSFKFWSKILDLDLNEQLEILAARETAQTDRPIPTQESILAALTDFQSQVANLFSEGVFVEVDMDAEGKVMIGLRQHRAAPFAATP